jgi:hypothetical protein
MNGWHKSNNLWYVGDRLLIPRVGNVREIIFRLAHRTLGHFGADKSYAALCNSYYWPIMHHDLEQAYIPSCTDCLQNKSRTTKPPGALHPLPIPESHGDSIAMDFVGPLPTDNNFDCILTIMDRLGADIRIVPTWTDITTEDLAIIFFNNWYCENRLLNSIVCDHDKLFVSRFWKSLTKLTGVKLKMSTSYHPELTAPANNQIKC